VRGNVEAIPAFTVSESGAECESEPLEPLAVTVKFPVAALALAPRMRVVFALDAREKGLEGLE
jgi:hypothetical protein